MSGMLYYAHILRNILGICKGVDQRDLRWGIQQMSWRVSCLVEGGILK